MFETYRNIIRKYPKLSIYQERRLIKQAQGRSKVKKDELVLRHIGFVIFRIHKIAFPAYRVRFGEDILSQAILILYDKIKRVIIECCGLDSQDSRIFLAG